MGRRKLSKNPTVTDIQRERVLKRRIMEWRGDAEQKFSITHPRNKREKLADFLEEKTRNDHITCRIIQGVIEGTLQAGSYPKTKEEKYDDQARSNRIYGLVHELRLDKKCEWLGGALGEIEHENPDTQDIEYIYLDASTEQGTKRKRSQMLQQWETNRNQTSDTINEVTQETVRRALLPKDQRRAAKDEERRRRRQRDTGS